MDQRSPNQPATVSNLIPVWDVGDGGGSYEPATASQVVEAVVEQAARTSAPAESAAAPAPRRFAAPEQVDPADRVERRRAYEVLVDDDATWAERSADGVADDLPAVDYDLLHRREIAKQLLRVRLVRLAEQREHRSAYEIVFILLAFAVAVLLAAPPLVQVLLAAHGTQV
jgi:hypothetical protein